MCVYARDVDTKEKNIRIVEFLTSFLILKPKIGTTHIIH